MPAETSNRKIRVVVAKPGLDGHDRGAKIIARALRDAGMEVIYTGLHQTPEQIVETVLQEDADAVGLSILSGAHMTLVPRVVELLREQDAGDVIVTVGGTIPAQDIPELKELGVAEVFTPGAPTSDDHRRSSAAPSPPSRHRPDGTVMGCPSASSSRSRSPSRSPPRSRCAPPTGSRKPCRRAIVVVGYATSFYLLSLILKELSVGTTYAIWAGAGTAAIAVIGIVALGEPATAIKLASIALIIAGVIGLNLSGVDPLWPGRAAARSCSTPRSP